MDDPTPPSRAIAIAIPDSVTVSIVAVKIDVFKRSFFVKLQEISTVFGNTLDSAGIRSIIKG